MVIKRHAWKYSRGRADWVIVIDADEFLYHPNMLHYLANAMRRGVSVVGSTGCQMVSERFEGAARTGFYEGNLNKTAIFSPNLVQEMSYSVGGHRCRRTGQGGFERGVCLLHQSHLGREETWQRYQARRRRVPVLSRLLGVAFHYHQDRPPSTPPSTSGSRSPPR
jgi:hypothetical protein